MSVQPPHGFPDPNQGHHPPQGGPQGPYGQGQGQGHGPGHGQGHVPGHGHGPVPPGYPQQPPQGGFPPPGGPGYPGGPQGPFPPGAPQGGFPGAPAPRPRRTGLIVGGAIAGAVVLLGGIGLTIGLSGSREYVSFPDCEEVFETEPFEAASGGTDLDIHGEFTTDDESESHGVLHCSFQPVDDPYATDDTFFIMVVAHDPESGLWQEHLDKIDEARAGGAESLAEGERGPFTLDGEALGEGLWRSSPNGDIGVEYAYFDDGSDLFSFGFAVNVFIVDNLEVSVTYGVDTEGGDPDLEGALDLTHEVGDEVERAVLAAGETA